MGAGSRCAVLRFICGHALGNAKQYHERNVLATNVCRDRREVNAAQATTKQRCLMCHQCSQLCIATRVRRRKCKAREEKCQEVRRHGLSSTAGGTRTEDWLGAFQALTAARHAKKCLGALACWTLLEQQIIMASSL
ncbi:hypothetical protein TRVL_10385 [Trypanosoma vivax]|nr:hypothetical protein TRVL_10385 [Trypanosoma vivax]